MVFEKRKYQIDCAKAWYEDICKEGTHPLIAVPTGAGKTAILGLMLQMYFNDNPHNHVVILSHTQEILSQDYIAIKQFLPNEDIGIYSASLNRREICQVTIAGIQTIIKNKDKFKWTNLWIVDEAHAVNHKEEGSYRRLFNNTLGQVAGMSATIFRMGHGYLHEGPNRVFNKLSYDLTSIDNFNKLIEDGYLCKLVSVAPNLQLDSSKVKRTAGDYNIKDLSNTHDKNEITKQAISELLYYGKKYKKWLIFAIDINHAEHITNELIKKGINAKVLHTRMDDDRQQVLNDYKDNKIRALVNVGIATVGLDVPDIDLIALLRPTRSTVLHVQMIGRGLRPHPNKDHCLILDFAGNTELLGPINNPVIPRRKGKRELDKPITKLCPKCRTICWPSVRICPSCGHEFIFQTKLRPKASSVEIIASKSKSDIRWESVMHVFYVKHEKKGKPPSLKIIYQLSSGQITEWIFPQYKGYAGRKSRHILKYRGYNGPMDVDSIIKSCKNIKVPSKILVDYSSKYPTIKNAIFN